MGAEHDAKIIMHLGGIGCQRDRVTDEIHRIFATELMRRDAEKMEARRVAGFCRAEFPAQAFGLGEAPRSKMPDGHGKLFGNCGWSLVSAR